MCILAPRPFHNRHHVRLWERVKGRYPKLDCRMQILQQSFYHRYSTHSTPLALHGKHYIIYIISIVLDTVPLTTWCQCAAELQFAYNYRAETRRGRCLTITAAAIRVVTGTGRESEVGRWPTPTPGCSPSGYLASVTWIVDQTTPRTSELLLQGQLVPPGPKWGTFWLLGLGNKLSESTYQQ